MSAIASFFKKVEADFKVVGHDIKAALSKLFGADFVSKLESTAEDILTSDLGKAVLVDATTLLAQVQNGTISQATAITQLAVQVEVSAKMTGVALESSMSSMVAAAAIAKLTGVVGSSTPTVPTAS